MLVRQLVGRRAGEIIDMDYANAMACKSAGTIALIEPNSEGVVTHVVTVAGQIDDRTRQQIERTVARAARKTRRP